MSQRDGGEPNEKAEWVWLMLQLADADRATYRLLRHKGWLAAAARQSLVGKSDKTN